MNNKKLSVHMKDSFILCDAFCQSSALRPDVSSWMVFGEAVQHMSTLCLFDNIHVGLLPYMTF